MHSNSNERILDLFYHLFLLYVYDKNDALKHEFNLKLWRT